MVNSFALTTLKNKKNYALRKKLTNEIFYNSVGQVATHR